MLAVFRRSPGFGVLPPASAYGEVRNLRKYGILSGVRVNTLGDTGVIQNPDGSSYTTYPDGSTSMNFADGSIKYFPADGSAPTDIPAPDAPAAVQLTSTGSVSPQPVRVSTPVTQGGSTPPPPIVRPASFLTGQLIAGLPNSYLLLAGGIGLLLAGRGGGKKRR
jgi:hypothetical protein